MSDTPSGNKISVRSLLKYCVLAGAAYVTAAALVSPFSPVPDNTIFEMGVWLSSRVSAISWGAPVNWHHPLIRDPVVFLYRPSPAMLGVLAVLHTLVFVASVGVCWQFGRPKYLPDVVGRTGYKLVAQSWMLSAWSCVVLFPLAHGAWGVFSRIDDWQRALAPTRPSSVNVSLAFLYFNVAFLALTLAYVSVYVLCTRVRRSVPSDLRRCDRCGYLLFGLEKPRCPECGTQNNRARPPRFGLFWRPSGWLRTAGAVCYLALCVGLLTAPVLVPWLYGRAVPVLARVWPGLPRPAEPCALGGFALSGEASLLLRSQGAVNRLRLVPDEYGWWLYETFTFDDAAQTANRQPVRAGRGVLSPLERRAITLGPCTVYCTPISDKKMWIEPAQDVSMELRTRAPNSARDPGQADP